ncbi:MAG: rane protein [Pseudomonadota bacterium]
MIEFLTTLSWAAVIQIIIIDILLGGDNAVVIALACRNLPPHQRTKGILWGTAGAIILRVILIAFAVALLKVPFVKLVGGLLLIWIGVKLLAPGDEDEHGNLEGAGNLMGAIKTVIVADLVMSVDNVIAIAGAAQQADPDHQLGLVIFGLLVSIPLIVWGSQIVLKLIDRFPIVVLAGGALLGWIAGGMMITDIFVEKYIGEVGQTVIYACSAIGAALVVALGKMVARMQKKESTA